MSELDELLTAAALARLERAGEGDGEHGHSVAVVVDELAPAVFVRGAIDFALGIAPEDGRAWLRAFTRTIFLAGRPATVALRFPAASTGEGLSWHGPAPAGQLRNLSRLLHAFEGAKPAGFGSEPVVVHVPGPPSGTSTEAAVACAGLTIAEYLVHTHHLLAEAVLRGLIGPGDTLTLHHRDDLDGPDVLAALAPGRAAGVQTRITHDPREPGRLRLFALLTSDRKEPAP